MTTTDFGKVLSVSHAAVLKCESLNAKKHTFTYS